TSNDPHIRKETAAYLVALTELCSDLGGKVMVFGSPAQRRIPDGGTRDVAAERFLEAVRPALDLANECSITICLEPLPPPEADFLLTLNEARSLIHELAPPAAKTIFDVKSASSEERPLADLIREFAPYIAHVHANDANRRGPGFGDT